jgi:hypothetical protein
VETTTPTIYVKQQTNSRVQTLFALRCVVQLFARAFYNLFFNFFKRVQMDIIATSSSNTRTPAAVRDSLQQAEDLKIKGEFDAAKKIYFQLLNDKSQTYQVHWEVNKQIVQMQFGWVGTQRNNRGVEVRTVGYSVKESYQLDEEVQEQFARMSADSKKLHAQCHFELATIYQQGLPENPGNNSSTFSFGKTVFDEGSQEFKQALCIAHLRIASFLESAKASLELAKIYKKANYLIPPENPQKSNTQAENDSAAEFYAKKAEAQASSDPETYQAIQRWRRETSCVVQ